MEPSLRRQGHVVMAKKNFLAKLVIELNYVHLLYDGTGAAAL
jgi:hypothetical protein